MSKAPISLESAEGGEVMIVAGEASGEMYGARLATELQRAVPGLTISGMGGPAMAAAGVEILVDTATMAVMGLVEVISHFFTIRAARKKLVARMKKRPRLLILIDYAEFNLLLAKEAKALGIPVLYYISPKVWVWRSGRVAKIKARVDAMAVILPFEVEFYRRYGMEVTYVGHPLVEMVKADKSARQFLGGHGLTPKGPVIGILPGSRKKEVAAMLPVFLAAAARLAEEFGDLTFILPLAPTISRADLEASGLGQSEVEVAVIPGDERYELMAACDLVMAASGTVTLELAILQVPMIVSYRLSPLTYHIGRRLIKVEYASLVNLIAGRPVVPELLQYEATGAKVAAALARLMPGSDGHRQQKIELAAVRDELGQGGCAKRVADLALATMGK
ncbi:MAG: lipid-A-disaccharide synthase [Thermodesulfobacteriota bacterium]